MLEVSRIRAYTHALLPLAGFLFAAFGLSACGGGTEAVSEQDCVPQWYPNPAETQFYVRAPQTATAGNMQIALDKAKTGARGDIASRLRTEVEGMTQTFVQDLNEQEAQKEFVESQETATSQVLRGSEPAETKICQKDDGTYRAFVLMEMPVGKVAKEFNAMLKQNEDLHSRFQDSEAFEKIQKAIEQYEKEQTTTPGQG